MGNGWKWWLVVVVGGGYREIIDITQTLNIQIPIYKMGNGWKWWGWVIHFLKDISSNTKHPSK